MIKIQYSNKAQAHKCTKLKSSQQKNMSAAGHYMGVSELFQFHHWNYLKQTKQFYLMRDHGIQINLHNQILYILRKSLKFYPIA